jgi:peptide deformylase
VRVAVRPVITWENPKLRKKSIKVSRIDQSIQDLIDDMIDTMHANEGIGLAAPQIGVLYRIIVCEYTDEESEELQLVVLINPEITDRQGEWMAEEGCLSIPGYFGTVPRAVGVTARGKDRRGKDVKIKTDGVLAHVLQHETDHLDGILFIDYLDSLDQLEKVRPERRRRRRPQLDEEGSADEFSEEFSYESMDGDEAPVGVQEEQQHQAYVDFCCANGTCSDRGPQ